MKKTEDREQMSVAFSVEEYKILDELSEEMGHSRASYLRFLLMKEYRNKKENAANKKKSKYTYSHIPHVSYDAIVAWPIVENEDNSISALCARMNYTKTHLSKLAGVSVQTIYRIERGMPCTLEVKRKILKALGLNERCTNVVFAYKNQGDTES